MPQTREHLQILKLLQIPRGILVLTKCDLAEARLDRHRRGGGPRGGGRHLPRRSAPAAGSRPLTGAGLPELTADHPGSRWRNCRRRMPTGRCACRSTATSPSAGFGTVVTGTLLSGTGAGRRHGGGAAAGGNGAGARGAGPRQKGRRIARAGQRVAVNLAGLERDESAARRGASAPPDCFELTERLDARLTLLAGSAAAAEIPRSGPPLSRHRPGRRHRRPSRPRPAGTGGERPGADPPRPAAGGAPPGPLHHPLLLADDDHRRRQVIDPNPVKHRRFRHEVMAALAELESGETRLSAAEDCRQAVRAGEGAGAALRPGARADRRPLSRLAREGKVLLLADQWATVETGTQPGGATGSGDRRAFIAPSRSSPAFPAPRSRASCPATWCQRLSRSCWPRLLPPVNWSSDGEVVRLPGFAADPASGAGAS